MAGQFYKLYSTVGPSSHPVAKKEGRSSYQKYYAAPLPQWDAGSLQVIPPPPTSIFSPERKI